MNRMRILVLASAAALAALTGCRNSIDPGQGGTLMVTMNETVSRSILPGISMNPVGYDLVGTGPEGAGFSETTTAGSSITIPGLAFGEWTVSATAKNSDHTAIGQGSGTVTVVPDENVGLAITVHPYDGFGTLALKVSWPAARVGTARIESTLTPFSGSSRDLAFSVNAGAGTAHFSADDVATGYHTLILKLLDDDYPGMSAVEVVRIVKEQATNGNLIFTNVNQGTEGIEVDITPEMGEPLSVTINGGAATKPQNQSLTLSAAVINYSNNVIYVWYVNGTAVATGADYSFDDTWAQGYDRIDVTAFSADGKRAGSATADIQVVAPGVGYENYSSPNIGTLVYVPSGSFQRDAEAGNISVITKPFRMSTHEITRAQFLSVMGTDPSETSFSSGTTDPVQMVNWYQTVAFCNKLSLAEGLTPVYAVEGVNFDTLSFADIPIGVDAAWDAATASWTNNGYRLPTEMEWMWAAMGATSDRSNAYTGTGINTTGYIKVFAGSTGSNAVDNYVWYSTISNGTTHPVGTKLPNELGLYDMSGNVWEWCWDWYAETMWPNYAVTGIVTDYKGAAWGIDRVTRGGSWYYFESVCTVAYRFHYSPHYRFVGFGFRVVRS